MCLSSWHYVNTIIYNGTNWSSTSPAQYAFLSEESNVFLISNGNELQLGWNVVTDISAIYNVYTWKPCNSNSGLEKLCYIYTDITYIIWLYQCDFVNASKLNMLAFFYTQKKVLLLDCKMNHFKSLISVK